jgi:nitrate reductase NapAB chaperone NapD
MPVSSWVITVARGAASAGEVARGLAAVDGFEIGEAGNGSLHLVVRSASPDEDTGLYDRIMAVPGIAKAEFIFVAFDAESGIDCAAWMESLRASTARKRARRQASP